MPLPPYYSNLAPYDFSLFPKLKAKLKEKFDNKENTTENMREMTAILKEVAGSLD
jgi:hypothetical protein